MGPRRFAATAGVAALTLMLTLAPPAHSDALLTNFDMRTYVTTYGGARTIAKQDQRYRWIDSTPQNSRISYNFCSDYSAYQYNDFGAGFTSYKNIFLSEGGGQFFFTNGTCFVIRGRSLGFDFYNADGSAIY